ncbi:hypothetical protein ACFC96_35470 [Streptomyces sp. NPDC055955]|uniref:hypothetical protein n=1 Tax=Streptomyces sp. NPDC055955 TaxID=3345665 RepID=UPI0035E051D6
MNNGTTWTMWHDDHLVGTQTFQRHAGGTDGSRGSAGTARSVRAEASGSNPVGSVRHLGGAYSQDTTGSITNVKVTVTIAGDQRRYMHDGDSVPGVRMTRRRQRSRFARPQPCLFRHLIRFTWPSTLSLDQGRLSPAVTGVGDLGSGPGCQRDVAYLVDQDQARPGVRQHTDRFQNVGEIRTGADRQAQAPRSVEFVEPMPGRGRASAT